MDGLFLEKGIEIQERVIVGSTLEICGRDGETKGNG